MEVGGVTYRLTHPASSEALIDEQDFERDERLPYWAELWPSALALARLVATLDLSGKRAVELGCGIGLPAIVAAARGADVLATDHYRAALEFTAYNARENFVKGLKTAHLDWQAPEEDLPRFDLVLAADVLYEKRNVLALTDLISGLLAPDGEAILADPRRTYACEFLEGMEERGFRRATESMDIDRDPTGVRVMLHRLRRVV